MNEKEGLNKPEDSIFTELSDAIKRLKQQAKDSFHQGRNGTEDDYELAYLRGYCYGQLAALEDSYNLFSGFLSRISQNRDTTKLALKQQLGVAVKVIDELTEKIKNKQSPEEYVDLIQNTILLIKESSKNI